jgi:hypothetical protein
MADGAAAELQHHVVAEQIEKLVHLAGVNAARGDRHHLERIGPILLEEYAARQIDRVLQSRGRRCRSPARSVGSPSSLPTAVPVCR